METFTDHPCFWGTFLSVSSANMLIFIAGKRRDDDDDDETSGKIQKARARVTEIYNLKIRFVNARVTTTRDETMRSPS